jgi:hypothetical protein
VLNDKFSKQCTKLSTANSKLVTANSKIDEFKANSKTSNMENRLAVQEVVERGKTAREQLKNERVKDQGTINMSGAIAKSQMNQQTMNVKAANKRQEATDKSTRKTERAGIIAHSSNGMNYPNGFLVRVGSFCFSLVDDYIELVLNSPSRLIIIYGRT